MQQSLQVGPQQAQQAALKRRLLVTLLTVIFYYYPSLLTATLSLFTCYRIDAAASSQAIAYPQNLQVSHLRNCGKDHFLVPCGVFG